MIDEHTRESPLHLVERSITAERPILSWRMCTPRRGGPPKVLRMDSGLKLISKVSQKFCADVNAAAGGADCPHSSRHGFR
jgi:putative transposase